MSLHSKVSFIFDCSLSGLTLPLLSPHFWTGLLKFLLVDLPPDPTFAAHSLLAFSEVASTLSKFFGACSLCKDVIANLITLDNLPVLPTTVDLELLVILRLETVVSAEESLPAHATPLGATLPL